MRSEGISYVGSHHLSFDGRTCPSTTTMLVAVAQMTSGAVIRDNLAVVQQLIGRAARAGANAIFLPEGMPIVLADHSYRLYRFTLAGGGAHAFT